MRHTFTVTHAVGLLATILLVSIAVPLTVRAQESTSDLRATIRAELLSDPRTAGLSKADLDTIVNILAQEAEKQGMTSQDIQWRPQGTERFTGGDGTSSAPECAGGFLCTMTEAFGFVGADTTIPFTLGAASMALVWLLAEMLHRHRHPVQIAKPATSASM